MLSAPAQYLVEHFFSNWGWKLFSFLFGNLTRPEVQKLPLSHNSPSCEVRSQETRGGSEDDCYDKKLSMLHDDRLTRTGTHTHSKHDKSKTRTGK